jgi:hypothetical protein
MKFSEYLRLNEGNYGHEFGEEAAKHEAALEANREHAAAKRDESTMAPKKPHLQVGANSQELANRTMSDDKQNKLAGERKAWRAKLRPTGDDGGAQAARDKANTVKEPSGEVMLDPKTGKPFPKKGPLKDWQIPSLKEDTQIVKDEEVPGKGTVRAKDKKTGKTSTTEVNMRGSEVENQHGETASEHRAGQSKSDQNFDDLRHPIGDSRRRGGARANPTPARGSFSKLHRESVEIPERDALGRLSIYSMQEASTPKPLRKALKKAKMGKTLSNKESGRVMRNTKADPSTRTIEAEKYKDPQDDIDAHDVAEADRRENAVGMDRQSHLDEPK